MAAPPVAPPLPRSPPGRLDLTGRRRLEVEVQGLDRQIGDLEEEMQSLEGLRSASRCCKEINEFVGTKPDPFMPVDKKNPNTCCTWKWFRSKLCLNFPRICCCSGCLLDLGRYCCACKKPKKCSCNHCCRGCPCSCRDFSCCIPPCLPCFSCPEYSCGCVWSCHKCTEEQDAQLP